jgi:site-specific recombinase XerC
MLASSGKVNIFQLRDLLTHKHIAQTMVYAHLLDTDLQKASNVCTDIINEDLGIESHDLLAN